MRASRIYKSLCMCILMILSSACHTEYCREDMYIQVIMKFYNYNSQNVTLSDVEVYTLDSRGNEISRLPIDSATSTFKLILNPEADTSRFRIKSDFLNNEELVIVHTNTQEFVSAECGCRTKGYIDTVYVNNPAFMDSISIFNHTVDDNYENEHIQMFLHIGE